MDPGRRRAVLLPPKVKVRSSVGLFLGCHLAFRPVGCLVFRIGRRYLVAGVVRYFIDIRIWMIGAYHGLYLVS